MKGAGKRILRIADDLDVMHRNAVAKLELTNPMSICRFRKAN